MSLLSKSLVLAGTGAGVALGTAAYAMVEARSYRVRTVTVSVLPYDAKPLRVLHIADVHLMPNQRKKLEWLRGLAELQPDLVINTGDNISSAEAIEPLLEALQPLLRLPGAFVFGSNDYYGPTLKNPLKYLRHDDGVRVHKNELPWQDLAKGLLAHGWVDLTNVRSRLDVGGLAVELRGVDDPHIMQDRYDEVAGSFGPDADLRIGLVHAPYVHVLDAMANDGADIVFAGHTHGGQVAVPGYGALVTNCTIDAARVKGLSTHQGSWLHVSAGIGTSPYTPIRLACPPEATLLTLVPRHPRKL